MSVMRVRATPPSERQDERVSRQSLEPWTHALGQHRVALAAGWGEAPLVSSCALVCPWDPAPRFRPRVKPLPGAEGQLLQGRLQPITVGRQAHGAARDLHRLTRAHERRSDKGLRGLQPLDLGDEARAEGSVRRPRLIAPPRALSGMSSCPCKQFSALYAVSPWRTKRRRKAKGVTDESDFQERTRARALPRPPRRVKRRAARGPIFRQRAKA